MLFSPEIFKAYDIRGLVKGQLSEELAYRVGRAFITFLRSGGDLSDGQAVVVGRDMRESSPILADAIMKGIQDEGVDVVNIGLSTTPLFNFACANFPEYAGGIMVTASHNPSEYNGFKMTLGNALPVGKNNGMEAIRDLVEKNDFIGQEKKGLITTRDVFSEYLERIFELVRPEGIKPLKIVIDAGNGMASATFPRMLKHLPVEVTYLYLEPDGTFPNHEANPLKSETLKELQKRVVLTGANFGFALDGDADRIGLVDEKGNVVDPSIVGAIVGLEVLRSHEGDAHMLYDLRSSMVVKEVWEKAGATTEMCMVGHALIKKMMSVKKADFASELSQHLYYADIYNLESTDLSLLYILQLLSREGRSLSQLIRPYQKYFHSGEVNFVVEDKNDIISAVKKMYESDADQVSHLDGLWLKMPWGIISLRSSNTEPVLRLNLEATTREALDSELSRIKKLISSS
ncbi:MAG: phosphomannomutase/phosphoglucomutase [Patescibacteria group bacterium]